MQDPETLAKTASWPSIVEASLSRRLAVRVALTLMLIALWSLTHRYSGLGGDAKLYAVQALSRIHPFLTHDLFLQNSSQDRFTIFSPLYAWCIGLLGLQEAALLLTIVFKVWFLAAAWVFARILTNSYVGFLAVASLIVLNGAYGAYGVFHYAEDWVTARSLGEALAITALAFWASGLRFPGIAIAVVAMFVHPLIALPVVVLLLCLWTPPKIGLLSAAAGVVATLALAVASLWLPSVEHVFTIMDAGWLEVTQARSRFLFLQLWSIDDWCLNARPFVSLVASALVLSDPRLRRLCFAGLLVGATGLAVALIASLIGPLAILVQGQAWRWVWVTSFASVLLLAPTAMEAWRDERCGSLCAILLICAWTLPVPASLMCGALTTVLWSIRRYLTTRVALYLRWAALATSVAIIAWIIANSWMTVSSPAPESGLEAFPVTLVRDIFGLEILVALLVWLLAWKIRTSGSIIQLVTLCAALLATSLFVLPDAFRASARIFKSGAYEFSAWRRVIPLDSNVFVVPAPNSAAFAWFALERPSYLSIDQSSGVIFSRQTALEVRRRAEVVSPLWGTNWQVRTREHTRSNAAPSPYVRPLSRDTLVKVCRDPQLNFVVAKENVGFDPIPGTHAGIWKDWLLYDCTRINSGVPPV
jgi:hypothetical protein